MSNAQVKPVPLGVSLDYHEKLINQVGKTLRSTRTKLHESELLLNLEPPEDEPENFDKWATKVSETLNKHENFQFPSLRKMQQEFEYSKLMRQQSRLRKYGTDDEMNQRANAILAKQTENMKKKVLEGKGKFGSSIEGEVLRVIPNYKGCNSHFTESRTLIRKYGRTVPSVEDSSLPPWIGPQYYPVQHNISTRTDTSYQVAFKTLPRNEVSSEVEKRSKVLARKKQLQELSRSLSVDHMPFDSLSQQDSREYLPGTRDWKELFNEEDWHEVEKKRRSAQLAEDEAEGEVADCTFDQRAEISEDGCDSVSEGRAREKEGAQIEIATATFHTELLLDAPPSASLTPSRRKLASLTSTTNPLPSSPSKESSLLAKLTHRQGGSDSIQREKLSAQAPYQLKIVHAEENYFGKRWKPKDYTKNALAAQRPLQLDTYALPPDFFSVPALASDSEVPKSRGNESSPLEPLPSETLDDARSAKEKPTVKFSSPIFSAKPSVFRSSGDIMSTSTSFSTSTKSKPKASSPAHPASRIPALSKSLEGDGSGLQGKNEWVDGSKLESLSTTTFTPHHHHHPHPHSTTNSVSTVLVLETTSPSTSAHHRSEALPLPSSPLVSAPNNSSSGRDRNSISSKDSYKQLLQTKESTKKALKKWYKQEGVLRARYQKVSDGEKWLADRPVLPSIALSLHGLLLEDNPFNGKTFESSFEIPESAHSP